MALVGFGSEDIAVEGNEYDLRFFGEGVSSSMI